MKKTFLDPLLMKNRKPLKKFILSATMVILSGFANASSFTEGFDDVSQLSAQGWTFINASEPAGASTWGQGNVDFAYAFDAFSGGVDSYITTDFNTVDDEGILSVWLISPEVLFDNGDTISFYTRRNETIDIAERLQLLLSFSGSSMDTGGGALTTGDFSTLALDINSAEDPFAYPDSWIQFQHTVSGLSGATSGRFALRYYLSSDAGPNGSKANQIGIDEVNYVSVTPVPEPSTYLLLAGGLFIGGIVMFRKRTRHSKVPMASLAAALVAFGAIACPETHAALEHESVQYISPDDTYIGAGTNQTQTYGSQTRMIVRQSNDANKTSWGFIKFDTSMTTGFIHEVSLNLYAHLNDRNSPAVTVDVFGVEDTAWTSNTLNWNTKPALSEKTVASFTVKRNELKWLEVDIAEYVMAQRKKGKNVISVALVPREQTVSSANIYTRETAQKPVIKVTATKKKESLIVSDGLSVWRKPDGIMGASCVDCHTPDAFDLAVANFSEQRIMEAAAPHIPDPTEQLHVAELIEYMRLKYRIKNPFDITTERPFQPGGAVIEGSSMRIDS